MLKKTSKNNTFLGMVNAIDYRDPIDYVEVFKDDEVCLLFDSALFHNQLGRYSFLAVVPFMCLHHDQLGLWVDGQLTPCDDPLKYLREVHQRYRSETIDGLPPFQGGVAGFWSYDWSYHLHPISQSMIEGSQDPYWAVACYDLVISFDHYLKRAWIISSGLPEESEIIREKRARERLLYLLSRVETVSDTPKLDWSISIKPKALISNFSKQSYQAMVSQAIEAIAQGDIFEVNLSQCFNYQAALPYTPLQLYQRLRSINPAPFAAYLRYQSLYILSSSPERFLHVCNGHVETRPIKGTRKRSFDVKEDHRLAEELLNSPKDRAENTMIVDLMRNDLSRVCQPHHIKVPQYCGLESYAGVHHLVSVVQGKLQAGYDALDLFTQCFPGGSISGAPKIRSLQIIDTLEPVTRGPYCGSIGYWGFDGSMDTSILIRSYVIIRGQLSFHVGGAILLHSDPEEEYSETLTKARLLLEALGLSTE